MYMQAHLSSIWIRLLTAPEAARRQAAQDLVELVAQAVFVDETSQNWQGDDLLQTEHFQLEGRDYHAIPLGRDVDIDTIEYLDYDYDGIALFVLRPGDLRKESALIGVRRTLHGKTDHTLLDLSRLSASFLQEIHGRLLQVVPARYNKEHTDLRKQIQQDVAVRKAVV